MIKPDADPAPAAPDAPGTPLPAAALRFIVSRGLSSLGTTLTTFGLNVWVFRETGSYAWFAWLAILAGLPSLLFAPFAGVLADRWNKKSLLLSSDVVSMLAISLALLCLAAGKLNLAVVALVTLVLALASELRWSALSAAIALVVPRAHLGRMNSLQQSFRGISVMLGPVLGAGGLDYFGLGALLALDMLSYLIGIVGLLGVTIARAPAGAAPAYTSFWHELSFGFGWVFARAGLRRLLLFFMAINIGVAVFSVTFAPYVLSFASSYVLGASLGLQGAGAVAAGMLLARWRMPVSDQNAIVWGALSFGLCMVGWGLWRAPWMLGGAACAFGVLTTIIMAASQTVWQMHVPPAIQGKVFAVRTVLSFGLAPLAILGSVPLAGTVFGALLERCGMLAALWGQGPGAAIGLMVSALGIGVSLCALALLAAGGLRLGAGSGTDAPPSPAPEPQPASRLAPK
ncbi:MFS transporter [Massilia sp. PAMC28688]|uniref:MFS transporter n=1 Tax=Massilia sp. PAMC28688 TaxID=2861283 RepID=UPI001C627017|nr:MFS transporter [Massilia sp. PAMC28688]QYF92618.1 MFS transporter [Massilia sp. PAMC28688]